MRRMPHIRAAIFVAALCILGGPSPAPAAPSHGLAMFGELKHGPDFDHFDYVNPDAPKGGTLKLATIGTFDSLNPFILKGIAAGGSNMIFETLLEKSADEPYAAYGLLAKSVDIAPDRSWVEFTLHPEARWHDGQPITADDVVFSFNILRDKGHPFYQGY
ncbi:MAG: ABC transporter substrate-binding protein, partial [Alphaproteobacteria bacterium]|nr:ABC transporter substrate-binding protein [Alphaproteobacteria bacterium]